MILSMFVVPDTPTGQSEASIDPLAAINWPQELGLSRLRGANAFPNERCDHAPRTSLSCCLFDENIFAGSIGFYVVF
jgi:hypothetical protein